jgi:hypothetical protein
MPHSWKAYELAMEIAYRLIQGNYIDPKNSDMVRGIIQIVIEDDKNGKGKETTKGNQTYSS